MERLEPMEAPNSATTVPKTKRRTSIATRWFANSFAVVAIILVIMAALLFFMLKQYYYGAVSQLLTTEANVISGVLSRHYETSGKVDWNEIRRSIEEFDKKNKMELMAINPEGEVAITSSGFSPTDSYETYEMPDFLSAKQSPEKTSQHIGRFESKDSSEKYMAVTVMLPTFEEGGNVYPPKNEYSAIRLVTSLAGVDKQIYTFTLLIGGLGIVTLLLLLLLGLYFIRSIVSPLRQIGGAAKRITDGDFSVRIPQPKTEDELSDLCNVINNMADELETSESLKNEFISSVSHELRTPLTAIRGWGETVLGFSEDETATKGMEIIIAETDRLANMVEELLDFSRLQNKSLSLQTTTFDILDELSLAIKVYEQRIVQKGINLKLKYNELRENEGESFLINGDKHRIRQVFLNIIDNAVKYSKQKSQSIEIDSFIMDNDITILIKDNGLGISKSDLPLVKRKFFKANNTRRGSGIGLAVADEIILMHGGKLDIKSKLNKGTTVKITLPLIKN